MVVRVRFWAALALAIGALLSAHAASAQTCYNVGTWNLEHFKDGKVRGFPELVGANGLPPRTDAQLDLLATTIRDTVDAKILVLNEINGRSGKATSAELDDLIARLGPTWRYAIAKSGGAQRVAVIWDSGFATEVARLEIEVPVTKVADGSDSSDIFVRDPLAVYFRFTEAGQPRNDLLVVGLHLASGQHLVKNHDAAMDRVRAELRALRGRKAILPKPEDDIMLAGDLNASPYDTREEWFFGSFNRGNWKLLAGASDYPRTRVNGSQIDYLIVTRKNSRQLGLFGEEIAEPVATVHVELADGDFVAYRRDLSDHFPVTTCVAVGDDTD